MFKKLNLFTHDGQFHADEVFATALLSLMCEDYYVDRGSDTELPEDPENWIIYDIGGGELDHHTPENRERNGTHPNTDIPYAACGLVWRKYYREILADYGCEERYFDTVYQRFETSLVLGIDAEDNGYRPVKGTLDTMPNIPDEQKERILRASRYGYTVSQMIRDYNPTWDSSMDYYEAFIYAVSFAKDIVMNRLDAIISSLDGRDYVMQCIDYSADHIMIMEQFAPWEGVLYSQSWNPKANDIWYVLSPALRGGWNVQCVLKNSSDRSDFRHPFPAEWLGLRHEELQEASGIATAVFCHPSGFLAGAKTQADAYMLAETAARR